MKQKNIFPKLYVGDVYSKIILVLCIAVALCLKQWAFAVFKMLVKSKDI